MKNCFVLLFFVAISWNAQAQQSLEKLDNAAHLEAKRGNYSLAIDYATKAEQVGRKTYEESDTNYIHLLFHLGELEGKRRNMAKAKVLLNSSLDLYRKTLGVNSFAYAENLVALADLHFELDEFEQVRSLREQAGAIYERTVGERHFAYIKNLCELAGAVTNDYTTETFYKGEKILNKAVKLAEKYWGKKHYNYAYALYSLVPLYFYNGKVAEAKEMLEKVNSIYRRSLEPLNLEYLRFIEDLATVYASTKEFTKAEIIYVEVLAAWEKNYGKKHPRYTHTLNNMAGMYARMEKLDKWKTFLQLSLVSNSNSIEDTIGIEQALFEKVASQSFIDYDEAARSIYNLSEYHLHLHFVEGKGEDIGALKKHYSYIKLLSEYREVLRTAFSAEKDKQRSAKQANQAIANGLMSANRLRKLTQDQEAINQAFQLIERSKMATLADALKSERALRVGGIPEELVEKEKRLQKSLSALEKQKLQAQQSRDSTKVAALRQQLIRQNEEKTKLLELLKKEYPTYHQTQYQSSIVPLKEIQARLLDDKTAIVEYFVFDRGVFLYIVRKDTTYLHWVKTSQQALNKQVDILRVALSNYNRILNDEKAARQEYIPTAYSFYKDYLLPDSSFLEGVDQLVIIPDGAFGYIPFEALLTDSVTNLNRSYNELPYLLKKYKVHYAYSASLLYQNQQKQPVRKSKNQLLSFAASYDSSKDPNRNLSKRSQRIKMLRKHLAPLPMAEREVKNLSTIFKGLSYSKMQATEANFRAAAANYGVIHLAMHGIIDKKYPIQSGLVFTEDGDSLQDNFLEAYEIANLDIQAELVVLSACETGYGKLQKGEGVMSLARSFMYAGVPSLVVSLWQVNDASTAKIMLSFYQNLAEGLEKNVALQRAKLDYIKTAKGISAHPAFWSPFIQIGDTQAITLKRKDGWLWWIVGGVGLVVIAGGLAMLCGRGKKRAA